MVILSAAFLSLPCFGASPSTGNLTARTDPVISDNQVLNGTVAWWRAEGSTGDSVGSHGGLQVGGVRYEKWGFGQSFSFDGTGEIIIQDSPSLNPQTFSIEAWVFPSRVDGETDTIINKEASDLSVIQFEMGIRGPGRPGWGSIPVGNLSIYVGGVAGLPNDYFFWVDGGAALPLNTWTHVAMTFDGSTIVTYVDGKVARVISGLSGQIPVSPGPLKIGSRSLQIVDEWPGDRFDGKIDEITLYNRPLSAVEIAYKVKRNCVLAPPDLVGFWNGEGATLDLFTGSAGTILANTMFTDGKTGKGFGLSGNQSGVVVPDSDLLNFGPGQNFSIEAWIKGTPGETKTIESIIEKRLAPPMVDGIPNGGSIGYSLFLYYGQLGFQMSEAPLAALNYSNFHRLGPNLHDGLFHHVAVTVDRGNPDGGRLYLDGTVILTFNPLGESGNLGNSEPFRIGNMATEGYDGFFNGVIDEVAVYRRALSIAEIEGIYQAGSAGKCLVPLTGKLTVTTLMPLHLNPQTGLFEQKVRVSNGGPEVPAIRLRVPNLTDSAMLHNATGSENRIPYVQHDQPLGTGDWVDMVLEYFVSNRQPIPAPEVQIEPISPSQRSESLSGTVLNVDRNLRLNDGRFLIEFAAIVGRNYAIQYSDDMRIWRTALPTIRASATRLQWLDDGPPKTVVKPSGENARFYRALLLP
jgi:hypothetical protein